MEQENWAGCAEGGGRGWDLGEEAEVNLAKEKDEGESKSCIPQWLPAVQEGKQEFNF